MDWGETIKAAHGAEFKGAHNDVVWREPVLELDAEGVCTRFAPYPMCSWCGSVSPKTLYELDQRLNFGPTFLPNPNARGGADINPAPHLSLADMKYGFPHKVYVETKEILRPDVKFVASSRWEGGKQAARTLRDGSPAFIKFYTVHLLDLDDEALELLKPMFDRALNRQLGRDAKGVVFLRRLETPVLTGPIS